MGAGDGQEQPLTVVRPISVLAVDDHPLLLDGIHAALEDQPDMRLVAVAADGQAGIDAYRRHRPDVTLMDLQMPGLGGLDSLRAIRQEFPNARIVVLTTYRGDVQVMDALKSGAAGFLLKGMLRKELRNTIRAVFSGQRVIPPEVAAELAEHAGADVITIREVEVLRCVARGESNLEAAEHLHISETTVKAHLKSIFTKLDAKDRTHAVMLALKRGILQV
jgi:two-component system, NarL family, response regulator